MPLLKAIFTKSFNGEIVKRPFRRILFDITKRKVKNDPVFQQVFQAFYILLNTQYFQRAYPVVEAMTGVLSAVIVAGLLMKDFPKTL